MNTETDLELIQRALAQDHFAVERLMERHRGSVTRLAYQALGNADDAQDVTQEALVYALTRLSELRDQRTFAGWLRHITLSLCVDYRRRRGTRRLGEPITLLNEMREEADFTERVAIRQALAHLTVDHRTTLLLHYGGGWSLEEVAGLLTIPINTVRSRLLTAKRHLRTDLNLFTTQRKSMPTRTFTLPENYTALLYSAFPAARILSVQNDPEPWMPFSPRVHVKLDDGAEKTVDFRGDINPARAALLPVLHRLDIPGPQLVHGPVSDGHEGYLSLCEPPKGENLLLWALGGTPHRIRLATERAFESIDRLQGITPELLADPVGATLPRRTLADEVAAIEAVGGEYLTNPWFTGALAKTKEAVADIHTPLVYTDYLHFFPNWVRILPGPDPLDTPLGWPGDQRLQANPLVEFVAPFGHLGDPLLGLAMVWIYDCYPFVHTGFLEQFLWRRNVTQREFAPRLAIKALQIIQRELPLVRPLEGTDYWDSLHAYVEQALGWL